MDQFEPVAGFLPRKVVIGDLDTVQLRQALREHNVHFNRAAEDLFNDCRFSPSRESAEIRIKAVSVLDLGFPSGATYQQLIEEASSIGLFECPLELGPYLRLQFLDQQGTSNHGPEEKGRAPQGAITVTSKPLGEADEIPKGFYLRRANGRLWLRGYWSGPAHVWSKEDLLVFAKRGEDTTNQS